MSIRLLWSSENGVVRTFNAVFFSLLLLLPYGCDVSLFGTFIPTRVS